MSKRDLPLRPLLLSEEFSLDGLDRLHSDQLKTAARFWLGKTAPTRKDACITALNEVFANESRAREAFDRLSANEREILAVCKRYGGAVSGAVLGAETMARGLLPEPDPGDRFALYRVRHPAWDLCERLVLLSSDLQAHHHSYSYGLSATTCPDVSINPALRKWVEPAEPLPWAPSRPCPDATATYRRRPAEVSLELSALHQALRAIGGWRVTVRGIPDKSTRNKLRKVVPPDESDPIHPPDHETLAYLLLLSVGAVTFNATEGSASEEPAASHLGSPARRQGWYHARAWLGADLWQDGIGVVPDRDGSSEPARIPPESLFQARDLLSWALGRVARSPLDWLDLETFLLDLHADTGKKGIDFYWGGYSWHPSFDAARAKDRVTDFDLRAAAYWMDQEGIWAANAVMGSLAYLGLVERGMSGKRLCFRLTDLGRNVFGAPDVIVPLEGTETKCLTVQPNHDVLAYLDRADAAVIGPLARMAARTSTTPGPVQSFTLTRESVYRGLESGLSVAEMSRFLREHSTTGLPTNVERSLAEWGRRREVLALRTATTLGLFPPDQPGPFAAVGEDRRVGDAAVRLTPKEMKEVRKANVIDHAADAARCWTVDDEGGVDLDPAADALALARLALIAERLGERWRITAPSVRRARQRGHTAEQILGWLKGHSRAALPLPVETMVRNWCGKASVYLGEPLLLQVAQEQAATMIERDRRYAPLLAGRLGPGCFLVRPEKRPELERLLAEMGFTLDGVCLALADADRPAKPRRGRKPRTSS